MDRIAVGVDGSEAADRALRWAIREAELHAAAIDLVHVFVVHPYSGVFGGADRELAQARLDRAVDRNRAQLDRVKWSSALVDTGGVAAAALLDAAAGVDLIAVGSRGTGGFARLTLGSTAYRTAAHSPTPVAVVAGDGADDDGRRSIVVGTDDLPPSRRALRWALAEAERRSTGVTVVHCHLLPVDLSPSAALNQRLFDRARAQAHDEAVALVDRVVEAAQVPAGVDVRRVVELGPPAAALLEHARGQLLVIGTRGQGTFSRVVFGSVSQQVLHHTLGPVVVVP